MIDAPLLCPRRLANACRLWLWFVCLGESKLGLWQVLRCYRRPEAAAKRKIEVL